MFYACAFDEDLFYRECKYDEVLGSAFDLFRQSESKEAHALLQVLVKGKEPKALVLSSMFSSVMELEEEFYLRHVEQLVAAAELGEPFALYSLAVYHDTGELVKEDKHKAFEYFEAAAEQGMAQAMHVFGIMLYYGTGGASKDMEKGLTMLEMSAKTVDEASVFLQSIQAGS